MIIFGKKRLGFFMDGNFSIILLGLGCFDFFLFI